MDQQTIDAYNIHAKNYEDETEDFWNQFPRTFFDKFIELSKSFSLHSDQREESSRGKVLDVGSGPGRDGKVLLDAGLDVICLDASQAMIDLSNERGLNSVLGDLMELPFDDASFDSVWAYTSLLHVPKSEVAKAFAEIRRVLKPNGVFGLGLIEGEVEEYRQTSKVTEPRWFSFYQKEEVEKFLLDHGFEIVYFETFKPNTKNYLNFISRKK